MKKVISFFQEEAVLCIAMILALLSMFVVHPDSGYIDYIDFRTLGILFCLMAVVAGLKAIGVFDWFAQLLLMRVQKMRQVILLLVLLCFFFSMIVTNDVALITFVPFTMIVLEQLGSSCKTRWLLPIVVMQTIAANLGSMLTPIGNPQNLYLYGKAGIGIGEFLLLTLPYTAVSLVLLLLWITVAAHRDTRKNASQPIAIHIAQPVRIRSYKKLIMYLILFVICLLSVGHIIPFTIPLVLVIVLTALTDRPVLAHVDYSLLATFIGFFIFIGNLGRIDAFANFLSNVIEGNEVLTAVIASQFMSNVPAALLLSGFCSEYELLIIGVNLGGLGTLIASMASLISFKYIGKEDKHLCGRYLGAFTISSLVFLALLLAVHYLVFTPLFS